MGVYEHIPYTNFHELNAAWILENTKTLLTRMDAAEARLTAAEARLTTAEGRLDAVEGEITSIKAEIVSIKSQITALTARMTAAETRLTTAEGNITAAVNRITALETRANAIELQITGLKTRMTAAEGDIDALEAREAIPAHTSSDSGKVLTATSSGVAWGTVAGGNLPAISAGDAGKVLTVNDAEDGAVWMYGNEQTARYFELGQTLTFSDIAYIAAKNPVYAQFTNTGSTGVWLYPLIGYNSDTNILTFYDALGTSNLYFGTSYGKNVEITYDPVNGWQNQA